MKRIISIAVLALVLVVLMVAGRIFHSARADVAASPAADNPNPPAEPVKLIFIHHSTGGNWLADGDGGLGIALRNNNYFVSDTNYGWGPDGIGDYTDIGHWHIWFAGSNRDTYTAALYTEYTQHASYSRLATDPGGQNEIILFKSCYPNSHLGGNPADSPTTGVNPLRGQDAWSEYHTVGNAKGIYTDLLTYFATRQDKLFVVITAPPLMESATDATHAANARAFNNWLVNDWLDGYAYDNVAVFDFYNVLTSNGGDANTDDFDEIGGNHHRWWSGAEQYTQTVSSNYSAYPGGDGGYSHPTASGGQKAAAEFVPLLNVFYHRRQDGKVFTPTNWIYLPLIFKAWSPPPPSSGDLVQPTDLVYRGAFRLPGGDTKPQTFAYGGNAMTFNPDGDPGNSDAYPGSLFITGHDRQAWETPDGDQVAEVSIPVPAVEADPADLPQAGFLQNFHDVTAGYFTNLEEIPKVGMQYLNHADTGPLIHLAWGQHLQLEGVPSHAWLSATLDTPNLQGVWFIGNRNLYSTNGYMFDIPVAWADAHAQSRYLATGRMRDGGQGGMGPTLFAYRPWLVDGTAPVSGTHLAETTLLLYENTYNTEAITRSLTGYQHPDEWEGGAWLTTPAGKSAVLFAGTKSTGTKYWYGYINPAGAQYPCVDADVTDFTTCRLADGSACPPEDFDGCCDAEAETCASNRGWWSTRFDAQFILYNPADLADVAAGDLESWQPQPYATLDIDEHLYLAPPVWDEEELGWGNQRRARIGASAFDRENELLYVLELYADEAKPVVHVWQVNPD